VIHGVRSSGSPAWIAASTPLATMSTTPGSVIHLSLRMMPSIA
jgi:hypothetical protein